MKLRTYRWYDIAVVLLPLLFPVWQYGQFWAAEKRQTGHQSNELLEFVVTALVTFRYFFPIFLAISITIIFFIKVKKEAAPRRTMRNFLNHLHEQYFSHPFGGRDPKYRVTVFVPSRRGKWGVIRFFSIYKYLSLYARSGDRLPRSKVQWNISKSEMEKFPRTKFDGIAAYAWCHGIFIDISDLPRYTDGTSDERKEYLQRTYLSEEKAAKLNVLSRSYQALVVRNRSGEKVGVLMMESEEPDGLRNLTPEKWDEIAKILQCLFLS